MTVVYSIYFPALSYLIFFVFVYNVIEKITMIALEWCNPYNIKDLSKLVLNRDTDIGTEKELIERERYRP